MRQVFHSGTIPARTDAIVPAMARTPLAIWLLGACCVAQAQVGEFSWALLGDVSQGEVGDLQDTDGSALSASHYFAPVDDSRGPYELAAFLDPASRISASVSHQKQTAHFVVFPGGPVTDISATTDDYTVGGRYVLRASKWYAGGDYTTSDVDPSPAFGNNTRVDAKAYHVLAGKYLGPNTSLDLGMSRTEGDAKQDFSCPPLALCHSEQKSTREVVGSSFLHVRHFRSLAYSLFGGVTQTNAHVAFVAPGISTERSAPRYWTYSFGAELFPTTKLGFRVGYTRFDRTAARADSYDGAATWFFRRNVGIEFAWSRAQVDSGFSPPNDTANLRFVGRF